MVDQELNESNRDYSDLDTRDAAYTRVAELAGQLNALEGELVETLNHIHHNDLWPDGYKSFRHWLTLALGVSSSHAAQLEQVVTRIDEFPLMADKFTTGRISFDQTRAVVADAPHWADIDAADGAEHATVAQIRRMIRTQFPHGDGTQPANPDTDTPEDTDREDADSEDTDSEDTDSEDDAASAQDPTPVVELFNFGWTPDGRFKGSFDLSADTGLVVEAALKESRDRLFHDGIDATWAFALGEIACNSLENADPERAARFKQMIHVQLGDDGTPDVTTETGMRLPDHVRQRLGCDTIIQPVWERDFTPIGVGHTTRTIPERLRRIIVHRDQGCRVPGCCAGLVEIHHIIHWEDDQITETWNLVSLCPAHHKLHHHGQLFIRGNPDNDSLEFLGPDHQPLARGPDPTPPNGPPPKPAKPYMHPSGRRIDHRYAGVFRNPERQRQLIGRFRDRCNTHRRRRKPRAA